MYVPIALSCALVDQLTLEEKEWINGYHAAVLEKLSPLLNAQEVAWLTEKCKAI